ncbi:MAG: glucosaminidase domain-containing protein [Candidatus Pacebacteria bacterium]|nr:glucosaminidase domain-containing protein [Candidatus Paceibacterota bacterium]MBP9851319.1 glucosaminidase domain-containing protein [Candidatus Paceibacterota bacterium]
MMDRREFIKTSGEALFGKAVGLDALAEKYESNIFPEVQTNLKGSAWKDKNSYDTLRHKYFLTNDQWASKTAPQAERKKIREYFYKNIEPIAVAHANKIGIPKDIYIMMAAKESNFGTSFLAQVAGNPFNINVNGKTEVLKEYTSTIKWNDDGTIYDCYQFRNLNEAFDAFDKLFLFWKKKSEFAHIKTGMTEKEVITLLTKPWAWGAGKANTPKDYNDWLERVTKRTYR